MTTLALREQISLGSIDCYTYAHLLEQYPTGLDEMPPLRGQDEAWAGLPGRRAYSMLYDSRSFDVPLLVTGTDAAGNITLTTRRHAQANLDALKAAMAASTLTLMAVVRRMPDGTVLTAQGRCIAMPVVDLAGGELFRVVPKIWLPDPSFYGTDVVDSNRTVTGSGMTWSVSHPGTMRGWKTHFALHGAITNPRIQNTTTGALWQYNGTVGSSETLDVDSEFFTAAKGSTSVIGDLSHDGDVSFMTFDPGANTFAITGTGIGVGCKVTTTLRPPYL